MAVAVFRFLLFDLLGMGMAAMAERQTARNSCGSGMVSTDCGNLCCCAKVEVCSLPPARDDMFRQVAGLDGDQEKPSNFLKLNFCVLRGMSLYDSLNSPADLNETVLELWISMAKKHLAEPGGGEVPGATAA